MNEADLRSGPPPCPPATAAPARPGAPHPVSPPTTIASAALFGDAAEVRIDHDGVLYRLRRTALGKLILTK